MARAERSQRSGRGFETLHPLQVLPGILLPDRQDQRIFKLVPERPAPMCANFIFRRESDHSPSVGILLSHDGKAKCLPAVSRQLYEGSRGRVAAAVSCRLKPLLTPNMGRSVVGVGPVDAGDRHMSTTGQSVRQDGSAGRGTAITLTLIRGTCVSTAHADLVRSLRVVIVSLVTLDGWIGVTVRAGSAFLKDARGDFVVEADGSTLAERDTKATAHGGLHIT